VQCGRNSGMFFQLLEEGKIRTLVAALENLFKISDGLVRVKQEREMKFFRHGATLAPSLIIP